MTALIELRLPPPRAFITFWKGKQRKYHRIVLLSALEVSFDLKLIWLDFYSSWSRKQEGSVRRWAGREDGSTADRQIDFSRTEKRGIICEIYRIWFYDSRDCLRERFGALFPLASHGDGAESATPSNNDEPVEAQARSDSNIKRDKFTLFYTIFRLSPGNVKVLRSNDFVFFWHTILLWFSHFLSPPKKLIMWANSEWGTRVDWNRGGTVRNKPLSNF